MVVCPRPAFNNPIPIIIYFLLDGSRTRPLEPDILTLSPAPRGCHVAPIGRLVAPRLCAKSSLPIFLESSRAPSDRAFWPRAVPKSIINPEFASHPCRSLSFLCRSIWAFRSIDVLVHPDHLDALGHRLASDRFPNRPSRHRLMSSSESEVAPRRIWVVCR